MNNWLNHSPFLAVGDLHLRRLAGLPQPAEPDREVGQHPARKGWRLLPITLGPQASCQPRFPRYHDDFKINPKPGKANGYSIAKRQGTTEGGRSVAAAQGARHRAGLHALVRPRGLHPRRHRTAGSRPCSSSAAGSPRSAPSATWPASTPAPAPASRCSTTPGSTGPSAFALPDAIWIARWDGIANTSTSYIRDDGWRPGGRVKQYAGGHDETWGGVRINIDCNFLEVGRGSIASPERRCGGTRIGFYRYDALRAPTQSGANVARRPGQGPAVPAQGARPLHRPARRQLHRASCWPRCRSGSAAPASRSTRSGRGRTGSPSSPPATARSSSSARPGPTCAGCSGRSTRPTPARACARPAPSTSRTHNAVKAWQKDVGIPVSGVMNPASWAAAGRSASALAEDSAATADRPAAQRRSGRRPPPPPASAPRTGLRSSHADRSVERALGRRRPRSRHGCASQPRRSACRSKSTVKNGGTAEPRPEHACDPSTSAGRWRPRRW